MHMLLPEALEWALEKDIQVEISNDSDGILVTLSHDDLPTHELTVGWHEANMLDEFLAEALSEMYYELKNI